MAPDDGLQAQVLGFLDKHYVIFAIVIGLFISWLLRRSTKPKDDDFDGGDSPSLEDLLRRGTDPLELGGETDDYRWTQGEDEVDVYVPIDRLRDGGSGGGADDDDEGAGSLSAKPPLSKRDVVCRFAAEKIYLSVLGKVIMDGKPHKPVDPDECTWQIERGGQKGDGGDEVWLTLRKQKPTTKSMHWRSVIQGHAGVDPKRFGPTVMTVDPSDPDSMRRAVQGLK